MVSISDQPKNLIKVIRTREFPVILTKQQEELLEEWLTQLTTVWNISLKRLSEFDESTGYYSKDAKCHNPCSPINCEYRVYKLDENEGIIKDKKEKEVSKIKAPFTRILDEATVKSRGLPYPTYIWKYKIYRLNENMGIIENENIKESSEIYAPFVEIPLPNDGSGTCSSSPYLHDLKKTRMFSGAIGNKRVLSHRGEPNTILTVSELSNIQGVIPENGCSGFSCPIRPSCAGVPSHSKPFPYKEPLLNSTGFTSKGGLGKAIKNKNLEYHVACKDLIAVPYKFRAGVVYGLGVSWQEYDKSRRRATSHGIFRGKPKFKSQRDRVKTIVHPNPKGVIIPSEDDTLTGVPKLKQLKIKGLNKRWCDYDGSYPQIAMFKLCKRPNGWTIQLTGEFHINPKLKESKGVLSCDAGLQHALIFDNGQFVDNPRWYRKEKDKLARIQREISQKRKHRLILWLNHPDRAIEDIKAVVNVAKEDAKKLLKVKTEKAGKELIGQSRWERLKRQCLPDSNKIKTLEIQLKKQHRRVAKARKSFWDRLSTWIMRNYEVFICEDGLQKQQLRGKSAPKYENGEAKPNQKKAKSGLNVSLSDLAVGYFMAECERKAEEWGRTFIRYPAKNTTLECPICTTHNDMGGNYEGQEYVCSCCGYRENRDVKAAVTIAVKACEKKKVPFDLLCDKSKDAVLARHKWQEENKPKRKTKKRKKRE